MCCRNLAGGIKRGTVVGGKLEAIVGIDFGRLAGLDGLSFYSNILQLHGDSGPGRNLVGNLNTISNIEALPTTRLSELWLEQKFLGEQCSLRAGQLVVDTEFLFSQYFSFFMSSDWPTNPGRQYSERRTGLSAVDARRAVEVRSDAADHGAARACSTAIRPAMRPRSPNSATATV